MDEYMIAAGASALFLVLAVVLFKYKRTSFKDYSKKFDDL